MTTKRPFLADSVFANRVRETEHAPGHAILLDFAASILDSRRFKDRVFLVAMIIAIGFNILFDTLVPLPGWADWLSLVVVLVPYFIIARRRDRQNAEAFEAARDEWLDGERRPNPYLSDELAANLDATFTSEGHYRRPSDDA